MKEISLLKKRDEKILEANIKSKDDLINELYQDKVSLYQQLFRHSKNGYSDTKTNWNLYVTLLGTGPEKVSCNDRFWPRPQKVSQRIE